MECRCEGELALGKDLVCECCVCAIGCFGGHGGDEELREGCEFRHWCDCRCRCVGCVEPEEEFSCHCTHVRSVDRLARG